MDCQEGVFPKNLIKTRQSTYSFINSAINLINYSSIAMLTSLMNLRTRDSDHVTIAPLSINPRYNVSTDKDVFRISGIEYT